LVILSAIAARYGLLVPPVLGASMKYIDNSSERHDSYFRYTTEQERWADVAYTYIKNLDCSDTMDAFFTTKRECKELVDIERQRMNVYIASPSIFGAKYRASLPDEELTRTDTHDAVMVVDPFPTANFGHLVLVFYIDKGNQHCLTMALRKRCKNALERRFRRRNYAKRCEINFLPVVHFDTPNDGSSASISSSEAFPLKRENHLECKSNFAGFGQCPEFRTVKETSELICNPIRDNTQRCSTTHETVHTSCRMFETCDQAVILSGGWNRLTTSRRHHRNVELFYWMLREHGFKRRNIKVFFANGAEGVQMPGEHPHQVLPAAMKLAFRYHLQTMCATIHCVDALVLYMNSPAKTDGTALLWDVDGDGIASEGEQYPIDELLSDLSNCQARSVHVSYAGEVAAAFRGSAAHKNVLVFASGRDNEYAYNDDYTLHWHTANAIKQSSPIMREGEQGRVHSTIFGAPCDVTPEFSDQELREHYLGCQNLPTAEWLKALSSQGD
ncbi:hypothetical protein MAR_006321, partial [Mya arenaria]